MNYIAEIKAFYDRLELKPQPNTVIALWHALMSIANKAEWPDTFTAAQSSLMLKSGLSASAFKRARNRLAMEGFIEWKSRGGSLSAQYKMNSLVVHYGLQSKPQSEPQNSPQSNFEPQSELQSEPQSEPQNEPQSGPINKHKQEHKQNHKNTLCKTDGFAPLERDVLALFDQLWKPYPVKRGKARVSYRQKVKLFQIGYEEMERAISRYKKYVASVDYLHFQNGDTFFNKGYVDYLDANYDPGSGSETKTRQKNNAFNDYPHREYDFDAIRKSMFEQ